MGATELTKLVCSYISQSCGTCCMGHAAHKIPQHNAAELPPTTLTLPNTCLFVLKNSQSSFVTPQSMVKTPIYIDGEIMAARSERNFRQPQQTKRLGDQRFQSMALLSYCRFYSFFETALCRCRVFFFWIIAMWCPTMPGLPQSMTLTSMWRFARASAS